MICCPVKNYLNVNLTKQSEQNCICRRKGFFRYFRKTGVSVTPLNGFTEITIMPHLEPICLHPHSIALKKVISANAMSRFETKSVVL